MALNIENVKKIKQRRRSAVYGYIREQYGENIPNGVILFCLLFYGNDNDKWDKNYVSKWIKLDEENGIVTCRDSCHTASAFLTSEVDSGIHSWRFKIIKCTNDRWSTMQIGIWDTSKNDGVPKPESVFHRDQKGYSFVTSAGKINTRNNGYTEWGQKCADGTIDDLSLRFMINGKDYGKSHDILPRKYRAAVYLYYMDDSFQFIEKY